MTVNGANGQLTITNTSTQVAATNITGTALDGNVSETGNTCANLMPGATCTLTYTPGNTIIPQTNFTIQGSNTNILTAAIRIQSGSTLTSVSPSPGPALGGTGVTLTGTGLLGTTSVTFDGTPVLNFNVVNSTTVTAVTPPHPAGPVTVVINTPAGGAMLNNGYTYIPTTVGQSSSGGTIACTDGGLQNLIAATADNSTGIQWGGSGTTIGAGAQNTSGATNTAAIVSALGGPVNSYAASLCSNYEVDSQGNSPCLAGNICYNDWFLPAGDNINTGQLRCILDNRIAIGGFVSDFYWSSTEFSGSPAMFAWMLSFTQIFGDPKATGHRVRCVSSY